VVARRYRNRRIGEFLKQLKLTDGRIPTIVETMRANGSPANTVRLSIYFVLMHVDLLSAKLVISAAKRALCQRANGSLAQRPDCLRIGTALA
jgi:transposase InsO family protein